MDTRIFLIRHGATVLSAEDRFAGATDVELSDQGRGQVRALSRRLASVNFSAFYASPLGRTMETAKIVAEPHGLEVRPVDGFLEINHGAWEGITREEAEALYAESYARWVADPYNFAPENGETGLALTARALPALLKVVQDHPGQSVAVVSHKATIRLLLSSILGFDPRRYRDHLDLSPASLTIVDFRDEVHARLAVFNDISHYDHGGMAIAGKPSGRLSPTWS